MENRVRDAVPYGAFEQSFMQNQWLIVIRDTVIVVFRFENIEQAIETSIFVEFTGRRRRQAPKDIAFFTFAHNSHAGSCSFRS